MATAQATKPTERIRSKSDLIPGLTMGGIAFLLIIIFLIGPFFAGIYYSFTNQRLISANPTEFVGLRNYIRLVKMGVLTIEPLVDENTGEYMRDDEGNLQYPRSRSFTRDEENYPQYSGLTEWFNIDRGTTRYVILAGDPIFMRSVVNNFFFALVVIPLQTGIGLILALAVNQGLRGQNFFRTMYFAPVVTSMVVVATVWRYLYDSNNGLINEALGSISFGAIEPINWLGDPAVAMWAIIIMSVWQGAGFQMMLFVAGLQQISNDLYEAAAIDGANSWQKFIYVTIPGLRNVMVFNFIIITIAAFQLFDQVLVMTNGGPDNATTTTVFHMFRNGYREQDIAYASSIAVIFFLIILFINFIQRRVTREEAA